MGYQSVAGSIPAGRIFLISIEVKYLLNQTISSFFAHVTSKSMSELDESDLLS